GGEVEGVVVEQDRAKDRSFGFEIVRKSTFSDGEVWHQCAMTGGTRSVQQKIGARRSFALRFFSRVEFYALVFSGSPSAITRTLIDVATSRCSLTGIVYSPSFLIGSCSCSLRRSTSKPFAASASAISLVVTDP